MTLDGVEFLGWHAWTIDNDLTQWADAWSLEAHNPRGKFAGKIRPGQEAVVTIDSIVVSRGFVDDVAFSGDAENNSISVTGRDAFGPLADVSADPGTVGPITLKTLGERLGRDWVEVWNVDENIAQAVHQSVEIEPGDTPAEILQRLAEKDGVLIWHQSDGTARIGRPNYTQRPLHKLRRFVSGVRTRENNILSGTVTESWRMRYNSTKVAGSGSNDRSNFGSSSHRRSTVIDAEVDERRKLIVTDGDLRTIAQAKRKAEDLVSRQAMDGLTLEYEVGGHYGTPLEQGADPVLFDVDQRIDVIDEVAGIDGVYWLKARKMAEGPNGPRTTLTLHPNGWLAPPETPAININLRRQAVLGLGT